MRIGTLTFDPHLRRLGSAALTPKAARLLEMLAAAAPDAVAHESLYEHLWPGTFVEPGNLHNLIAELRAAAGDPAMIKTIHRAGYAMAWPVAPSSRCALLVGDQRIELRDGENILGRDQLNAADVSRRHARIVVAGDVTVQDLGSKNGTFVGTRQADEPLVLNDGDEVFFGRTRATFVVAVDAPTITAESRE